MNLIYLINGLGPGGAEHSLAELLPRFLENGIRPTIVCLKKQTIGLEGNVRELGCEIRFLPEGGWAAKVLALRRMLQAEPIDLVHTTLFDADVIGRLAAAGTGIPVLTSLVNVSYEGGRLNDPNVRRASLRAVQSIDAITARMFTTHFHAITDAVKDSAVRSLRIPSSRVTVVERGRSSERFPVVTPEHRQVARQRLGIAENCEVILNVGRQEFQKGQQYLLGAADDLLEGRESALILIAGRTGWATPTLETMSAELRHGDRVRFLGHRTDVADLLAAADVFVFPSVYEGLGGAVIEAMAMGIPVVASDLPALREVVEHEASGLLVTPADPVALRNGLEALLDNPVLRGRMRTRGREIFEERFTTDQSAERMIALYRGLVSERRAA